MNKPTKELLRHRFIMLSALNAHRTQHEIACDDRILALIEKYGDGREIRMWKVERDDYGFTKAISKNGQYILHLQIGTVFNEANADMVVGILNRSEILGADDKFIRHIQAHLKPGEEVICKICGKSAAEITEKESE